MPRLEKTAWAAVILILATLWFYLSSKKEQKNEEFLSRSRIERLY